MKTLLVLAALAFSALASAANPPPPAPCQKGVTIEVTLTCMIKSMQYGYDYEAYPEEKSAIKMAEINLTALLGLINEGRMDRERVTNFYHATMKDFFKELEAIKQTRNQRTEERLQRMERSAAYARSLEGDRPQPAVQALAPAPTKTDITCRHDPIDINGAVRCTSN